MENQHKHINGYRDLSAEEIALINEIKVKAEEVGALVAKVQALPGVDQRCASIAKTDAQTAFMWLVRAIAQPTTF